MGHSDICGNTIIQEFETDTNKGDFYLDCYKKQICELKADKSGCIFSCLLVSADYVSFKPVLIK